MFRSLPGKWTRARTIPHAVWEGEDKCPLIVHIDSDNELWKNNDEREEEDDNNQTQLASGQS
jgi:hypothetical protein